MSLRTSNLWSLFYQYEINGKVSDSMLVNTILMLVYVTKFFWWEAGYWNTMDIAHDRGMLVVHISNYIIISSKSCFTIWPLKLTLPMLYNFFLIFSWILYLLGLSGVGAFYLYLSRHVPCEPPSPTWNSGARNKTFIIQYRGCDT